MPNTDPDDISLSKLSISSTGSQTEDWDRSIVLGESDNTASETTPRNSVVFPADEGATPGKAGLAQGKGKRTLSELLRLHAEKGTDVKFSAEEASRVADVLGQWINAGSSPYEGEDDFFARSGSQDDLSVPRKRSPAHDGRSRGQSESAANSSAPGAAKT